MFSLRVIIALLRSVSRSVILTISCSKRIFSFSSKFIRLISTCSRARTSEYSDSSSLVSAINSWYSVLPASSKPLIFFSNSLMFASNIPASWLSNLSLATARFNWISKSLDLSLKNPRSSCREPLCDISCWFSWSKSLSLVMRFLSLDSIFSISSLIKSTARNISAFSASKADVFAKSISLESLKPTISLEILDSCMAKLFNSDRRTLSSSFCAISVSSKESFRVDKRSRFARRSLLLISMIRAFSPCLWASMVKSVLICWRLATWARKASVSTCKSLTSWARLSLSPRTREERSCSSAKIPFKRAISLRAMDNSSRKTNSSFSSILASFWASLIRAFISLSLESVVSWSMPREAIFWFNLEFSLVRRSNCASSLLFSARVVLISERKSFAFLSRVELASSRLRILEYALSSEELKLSIACSSLRFSRASSWFRTSNSFSSALICWSCRRTRAFVSSRYWLLFTLRKPSCFSLSSCDSNAAICPRASFKSSCSLADSGDWVTTAGVLSFSITTERVFSTNALCLAARSLYCLIKNSGSRSWASVCANDGVPTKSVAEIKRKRPLFILRDII